MIRVINPEFVIVTDSHMLPFHKIQETYPKVRIVMQNFADEHDVPLNIVETIADIHADLFLWIHYSVNRVTDTQKVLFYNLNKGYELIDEICISLEAQLDIESRTKLVNGLFLKPLCDVCVFYSGSNVLNCSVNPLLGIIDDSCKEFIKK